MMLKLFAMVISSDQFKEIMRLFDAGDFDQNQKAVKKIPARPGLKMAAWRGVWPTEPLFDY